MKPHLEQNENDNINLIICAKDDKLDLLFFSAFPASS